MKGIPSRIAEIFKRGSKTYFTSSLFFPEHIRRDVFLLYGFVRTADDFVDSVPQDRNGFYTFRERYEEAMTTGKPVGDIVVDCFLDVFTRCGFKKEWVDAFFYSMELDLQKQKYKTLDETLEYIYGSAEVIGLFMSAIMRLSRRAYAAAKALGRSMQYINFIRDIAEDNQLGRTYLPLSGSGLPDLTQETAEAYPEKFKQFVRDQAELYLRWQREAEGGFHYIPLCYRIPIMTASRMYQWTAKVIQRNPFIVFKKKVKPTKFRIILMMIGNAVAALFRR